MVIGAFQQGLVVDTNLFGRVTDDRRDDDRRWRRSSDAYLLREMVRFGALPGQGLGEEGGTVELHIPGRRLLPRFIGTARYERGSLCPVLRASTVARLRHLNCALADFFRSTPPEPRPIDALAEKVASKARLLDRCYPVSST
jgi:hypothetical protein